MKFSILTLLPEIYESLNYSVIGRAIANNLINISVCNIRNYSIDKHKKCDDVPFGGGAGMVMTPQPIHSALESIDPEHKSLRIYMSPQGEKLNHNLAKSLSNEKWITLINGSFEGVDQRVIDLDIDKEISIGDYILTSGDFASLVIINSISRFIPGVLGSELSAEDESFANGLLEYPQYTRPQNFLGIEVPAVLLSGNHSEIKKWRYAQSRLITKCKRPDLSE
ncbi:MAG: tRNA (guanine-N(1)-)-methyltransferase [Firmicutes bacterium ADurb.Bin080]|jgi:tRNA (guanine37-N1)-methyltransferase|nr:tRNA (guanosine(37)-N1)-methyltransferase TrmD [Clostridiales bacterium]OQC12686.1 MAG: tRNA (guanine-N(1)-)-methyltransferase [Firmicutes bacterium ADurb.Bin080]